MTRGRRTPAGEALARATSATLSVKPSLLAEHAESVARRAVLHRVPGVVAQRMRSLGLNVPDALARAELTAALTRLRTLEDLRFVAHHFARERIRHLIFKGPVLTTVGYRDVAERPASDLDLLVPRTTLTDAVQSLTNAGAELLDRNWAVMRERMIGEVHLRLPNGTALDLHWHLLVNDQLRRSFDPDHDALFESARPVVLDGLQIETFDAASTLVYTCLHACISGGHRLVWLKDLEMLLLNDHADPVEVAATADRWGCSLQVATMLQRTSHILGADVSQILHRIDPPRSFMSVMAAAERYEYVPDLDKDEVLLRLMTRAVGPTPASTSRRIISRLFNFGRRRAMHRENEDPYILFQERGSAEDRKEFFSIATAEPESKL